MNNVALYAESPMGVEEVMGFGADHVVVATGARWTKALCQPNELPGGWCEGALTPDDLAAGAEVAGPVVVFDFDGYSMGTGVAEWLAAKGLAVTYVTTAGHAGAWSFLTNEQGHVHQALARRGIGLRTLELVTGFDGARVQLAGFLSGEAREIAARSLVIVGKREGGAALHDALRAAGHGSVHVTGDAQAPGAIAHAVWQGRRTGEELGVADVPVRRDLGVPA
jgi:dimethylamine/trimethylamine dehydrogenase